MTLDLKLMQSQNDCMLSAFFFLYHHCTMSWVQKEKNKEGFNLSIFSFNEMYFLLQIYKHEGCFVDVILWHLEQ